MTLVGESRCAFCDVVLHEQNRSGEHVWSKWLHPRFKVPGQGRVTVSLGYEQVGVEYAYRSIPTKVSPGKSSLLNLKAEEVCAPCNNGWLSQLEVSTKPVLLRLLDSLAAGESPTLASHDASTLAAWLERTALVSWLAGGAEPPRGRSDYARFRVANGHACKRTMVWMARHEALPPKIGHAVIDINPLLPGEHAAARAAATTVTVGNVSFFIWMPRSGSHAPPLMDLHCWSLLWPSFTGQVEGPSRAIAAEEVELALVTTPRRMGLLHYDGYELPEPPSELSLPRHKRRRKAM